MSHIPENLSPEQQQALEAAAFRTLVAHLQSRTDVQNIDLMNLSGFCRNCLSKWLVSAAEQQQLALDYDQARTWVYGMPYQAWKDAHQTQATSEQQRLFEQSHPKH